MRYNVIWLSEDKVANGKPGNVYNNVVKGNTAHGTSSSFTLVYETSQWSTAKAFAKHSGNKYCSVGSCRPFSRLFAGKTTGLSFPQWTGAGNDLDSTMCANVKKC